MIGWLLLLACSLTRPAWTPCASTADCRSAFGFGSTCAADGTCAPAVPSARCARSWPADLLLRPEEYPDVVPIGAMFDQAADVTEVLAVELAFRQVEDRGGLGDRRLGLVQCTYAEDPSLDGLDGGEAAEAVALELAQVFGVPAIVGPATSSRVELAWRAVNEERDLDVLFVSPSATSPALTTLDGVEKSDADPGLFWRTAPPDDLQGRVMAADIASRGQRHVAAIYEVGPYGEGLVQAFVDDFDAEGRRVDRHPFADASERDVATQAAGESGVDEVIFVSGEIADIVAFLNGAGRLDPYADLPLFLADGARDAALLEQVTTGAELLDQVRGTGPRVPEGEVYDAFSAAFASAFAPETAEASSYSAHAYDAAWLTLYGVAWAAAQEDGLTGPDLARGLRRVSDGAPVAISSTAWAEVTAHFAAGEGVDVSGASGALDYDPATEETTAPIDVWRIDETRTGFETLYTTEP